MIPALLAIGERLLDKVIPDPVERDKAKAALLQQQQAGEFKELDARMGAIVAEAKSKDPWTSRARPSYLYVMYVMILMSIPMGILSAFHPDMAEQIIRGVGRWLHAIPPAMWATFGAGYVGYTVSRSGDKARQMGADPGKGLLSKLFG